MKWWRDITQDQKTGHYVARDLMKALAFFAAFVYAGAGLYAAVFLKVVVSADFAYALLLYSAGLQGIKAIQTIKTGSAGQPPEGPAETLSQ